MSGPSFCARADKHKEHVPMGLRGEKLTRKRENHNTTHDTLQVAYLLILALSLASSGGQFSNHH